MLKITTLQQAYEQARNAGHSLAAQHHGDPLVDEFQKRLAAGGALLGKLQSQGVSEISPLLHEHMHTFMMARMNFNRCVAIAVFLQAGKPHQWRAGRHWHLNHSRHITRWALSRLSWLRSRLLGYPDYYRAPPLRETLWVALNGSPALLTTKSWLKIWLRN